MTHTLRLYTCLIGILITAVGGWPGLAQGVVHVKGRISSNGEPIQGEVVVLDIDRHIRAVTHRTDSVGAFDFDVVPGPGTILVAKADGYISAERELMRGPGPYTSMNFTLSPAGPISGRVLDEAGAGVAGAVVRVHYPGDRRSWQFGEELGEEITDDFGNFTLPFVAKDRPFVVEAETTDRLPSSSKLLKFDRAAASGVLVAAGRMGHVVHGSITDPAGAPVADALVRIHCLPEAAEFSPEERNSVTFVSRTNKRVNTGPDGVYEFQGIPAGQVIVVASRPGAKPVKGEGTVQEGTLRIDLVLR